MRLATFALPALALVTALVWWWQTFGEVVGYGYLSWSDAGLCLLSENDICSLAKALCLGSHPRDFTPYPSAAFWVAASLLSMACFFLAPRESRRQGQPGG